MSRIRGKDTTPEKRVRSLMHRLGYRFRLHARISVGETLSRTTDERRWTRMPNRPRRKVPLLGGVRGGFVRPDIILAKYKTAIFVHGCFWHRHRRCRNCTTPTHRRALVAEETRRQRRPRQTSSARPAETWLAKSHRVGMSDGKAEDLGAAQSKARETAECLMTRQERHGSLPMAHSFLRIGDSPAFARNSSTRSTLR